MKEKEVRYIYQTDAKWSLSFEAHNSTNSSLKVTPIIIIHFYTFSISICYLSLILAQLRIRKSR
jgi:hypothetical protein